LIALGPLSISCLKLLSYIVCIALVLYAYEIMYTGVKYVLNV